MATPQTARVPTWARGLAAFEAETGEDFGGQTPEEAYGFTPDGSSTGKPGRIHGTSRQGDMSSLRAWRARSSVGPSTTSADIDNRLQAQEGQRRGQRYSQWEGFMRNQRQPFHGEIRMGGDKKPWKYNAMTGKGEPMAANPAQTVGSSAATAGVIGSRSSESPALPAPTPTKTTAQAPAGSFNFPTGDYGGSGEHSLVPSTMNSDGTASFVPNADKAGPEKRQEGRIEGKRFSDWKASLSKPDTSPTTGSRGNSLAGRKKPATGGADPEMMSERMAWVKSLGVNSKPYSTSAIRRVSN